MRTRVLLALLLATPVAAHGNDHAAALYSTQIRFDGKNVPIVSIGLVNGEEQIAIDGAKRIRVRPSGLDGPEVIATTDGRWHVQVERGTPARLTWRLKLDAFSAGDLSAVQAARKVWSERGVELRPQELGSVFGFFGKVLDTRVIVLTTKSTWPTREEAEGQATALAARHEVEVGVMPVVQERAHGRIVLSDGRTTIRADDALFLASADERDTLRIKDVEFGKGFSWHGREDRVYRGQLYVAVGSDGKLAAGNLIPAEVVLRGLVPAEIYPSAHAEALKVQAVSARGELLAKIGLRHLADPFLVCSDVHCQVYAGTKREDPRTDRAIADTRGEMLFDQERLVDTVYSASCGGHTEHNEHVWGGSARPTLRGKPDGEDGLGEPTDASVRAFVTGEAKSFCNHPRYGKTSYRWVKEVPAETLRKNLAARDKDPGPIRSLEVLARGVSGRATKVAITGDRRVELEGELVIRQTFGGLRSSMFVADSVAGTDGKPSAFTFTGGGFGHGVGMCQTGAIGRAEAGQGYEQILNHYFTGGEVERIY